MVMGGAGTYIPNSAPRMNKYCWVATLPIVTVGFMKAKGHRPTP